MGSLTLLPLDENGGELVLRDITSRLVSYARSCGFADDRRGVVVFSFKISSADLWCLLFLVFGFLKIYLSGYMIF